MLVLFRAVLHAANQNGSGKPRVLKNSLANQGRYFSRGRRFRKAQAGKTTGFGKLALLVPAAQAVKFIAADFHVEILHGNEFGERGDLVLRRENDVDRTDRIREAEFLQLRE